MITGGASLLCYFFIEMSEKMNCILQSQPLKIIGLLVGLVLLLITSVVSIIFGQTIFPLLTAMNALLHYDPDSTAHVVIMTERLARTLIAVSIGGSLAISGALLQAMTGNPLASPSIFGINAGALFFVVIGVVFFSISSLTNLMWLAFAGAALASALVFLLGTTGTKSSLSSIRIVLAGSALTALFTSITQGLLVIDEKSLEGILFWLGGSVSGRSLSMLLPLLPYMIGTALFTFSLGHSINVLANSEEVAKGLGQRVVLLKALMTIAVVILAGSSVAIGGSIGFIGLIIPHMMRGLVGGDYRWILPYSAVYGANLLLIADILTRTIIRPEEMPIGVITALLGVPFFIYIARRGFSTQ